MGDMETINKLLEELKEDLKTKASSELVTKLLNEIKARDSRIDLLEEKVQKLENDAAEFKSRVEKLEGFNAVIKNTVNLLERKIDDNEQYNRRSSLRIVGIPLPQSGNEKSNESLDKVKLVFNDLPDVNIPNCSFDRAHRIGRKVENIDGVEKQQMIVKFTTWRHRSMVYFNRKNLRNHKVYIDLTKRRFDLKKLADEIVKGNDNILFAMVDINCRLCLKLRNGNKRFFSSEDELNKIIEEIS